MKLSLLSQVELLKEMFESIVYITISVGGNIIVKIGISNNYYPFEMVESNVLETIEVEERDKIKFIHC